MTAGIATMSVLRKYFGMPAWFQAEMKLSKFRLRAIDT